MQQVAKSVADAQTDTTGAGDDCGIDVKSESSGGQPALFRKEFAFDTKKPQCIRPFSAVYTIVHGWVDGLSSLVGI